MSPHPPGYREHAHNSNDKIESMEEGLQHGIRFPLLTQLLSDICQPQTPGQRAGECVNNEAFEIHPRYTRRKSYERANHWEQTAGEDDDFAEASKPAVRQIQIMMRNQNITPVLLNQRPATV